MNEWRKLVTRAAVEQVESEARAVAGRAKSGYTLQVVRDVRWVFSRRLKVSNVFDSLIAAGNSFQIVGEEKLKERLPKLVVQKGIDRRFWLAERRMEPMSGLAPPVFQVARVLPSPTDKISHWTKGLNSDKIYTVSHKNRALLKL